jgi:hypothetical protein
MRIRSLLAAAAVLATAAAVGVGPSAASSACYGAAARDPQHPCSNTSKGILPTLAQKDNPTESHPCAYQTQDALSFCLFGVGSAKTHIALLGDSHAWHWRAAVDVVAHAEDWLGYSLTGPGCSFSTAVAYLPPGLRAPCITWYKNTVRFLAVHPDISTVFVSQLNSTPEIPPAGVSTFALRVAGFEQAWTENLPKTVKHVIVIRDVPLPGPNTFTCLKQVLAAATLLPGPACATPRATALTADAGVEAVQLLHSKRYQSIDMSQYFCDAQNCFPVVGGGLVYRDTVGHMTVAFSRSLGPYLLRAVQELKHSW